MVALCQTASVLTAGSFDAFYPAGADVIAVVALSVLAESVVAEGLCANATLASSAEPARPAMVYLANISVLPQFRKRVGKTRHASKRSRNLIGNNWNETCLSYTREMQHARDQKPPQ